MNTEKRQLRYDFTAVEIHDLSIELANKTKELSSITEEKKSINSQFTARINEVKASTNKLSNQVSDGFEYREIDCEIQFNQPTQGKKTYIRRDSNTVVAVEAMTDYDWNLFNQPEGNLLKEGA